MKKALQDEMADSYGKDYSELYRLIPLAESFPESIRLVVASAVRLYEEWFEQTDIPGPFCSELVARFYERLGLALFLEDRRPERCAPNDLSCCALQPISAAIIKSEDMEETLNEQKSTAGHSTRNGYAHFVNDSEPEGVLKNPFERLYPAEGGDKLAITRRAQRTVEQVIEQANEVLASSFKKNTDAIFFRLLCQIKIVEILLKCSKNASRPIAAKRMVELCIEYTQLVPKLVALTEARSLEKPDKVEVTLARWHRIERSLLRNNALVASAQLKDAANESCGWFGTVRLFRSRKQRRRVLQHARTANAKVLKRGSISGGS